MIVLTRLRAALTLSLFASACATTSPLVHQECYNADAQLDRVLRPLEALRAKGCEPGATGDSGCERLRREIERLAVVCPGHAPTLMANAVLAYDDRRPATAQQFLDQLLADPRAYPDAAVLRFWPGAPADPGRVVRPGLAANRGSDESCAGRVLL